MKIARVVRSLRKSRPEAIGAGEARRRRMLISVIEPHGLEPRVLLAGDTTIIAGHSAIEAPVVGQGPIYSEPPELTPEQIAEREADEEESERIDPPGDLDAATGGPSSQRQSSAGGVGLQSAGTFDVFRSTALPTTATASGTSTIGEPNVANIGRAVLQTGNWYASISGDNGSTFGFINPYTNFPATGDFSGGFCCDQKAATVASRGMILWSLQYNNNSTPANGIRIVAYRSQADLLNNSYVYYDFSSQGFGLTAGDTLDFPQMQISSNYVYYTTNVFHNGSGSSYESLIWRVSLDQIQAGGSINYNYWTESDGASPAPTNNAGTTMYLGSVDTANSIRIYTQNESDTLLYDNQVTGLSNTYFGTHTSIAPDGNNWTGRADSRMQTAWQTGGTLGFMWNSAASSANGRPQPFVRAVRVNASNFSVIDQPDLWSSGDAWHYPSISVDARGHIAGVVFYGGPGVYPQVNAIINDDFSPSLGSSGWENYYLSGGTAASNNAWGDYTGSQRNSSFTNTWDAVGYVKTGTTITPYFYWFGRERDTPAVLGPLSDIGDTIATAQNTFVGPGTGSNTFLNPIWNPTDGTRDVDIYSFFGTAGSTVTLSTSLPTNGSSMDTILRLFNGAGGQLAYNDDFSGLYSQITNFVLPYTGTYYAGVSGYSNGSYNPTVEGSGIAGSFGDYQFTVSLNAAADVGDTIASATATGLGAAGGSYSSTGAIGDAPYVGKDVDVYSFYGIAGSTVTTATALPSGRTSMDTILRLFNAAGTQLAYNDDFSGHYSQIAGFVLPYTGLYYIGVSGYSNGSYNPNTAGSGVSGSTGDYTLSVSLTPAADVGDTITSAAATGLGPGGGTYTRVSAIGDAPYLGADVDVYRVDAVAGSSLTATTSLPTGGTSMDTILRLFDASGNQLAYNDDNPYPYSSFAYTFLATGTYYVGVSGYSNGSYNPNTAGSGISGNTGDYALSLFLSPGLIIGNASATEGGTETFTVNLDSASAQTITVNYATADGTAVAGTDYTATSGTLTFSPGQTSKTITVSTINDSLDEDDETFFVNLSSPSNAVITTGQGTGTIVDNDASPKFTATALSLAEGNSGTTAFNFAVKISAVSGRTVSVHYSTVDVSATAGSDYTATSGTLTFAPGETTKTVSVSVNGDTTSEADETFKLAFSAPVNVTLGTTSVLGTILNDDNSLSINDVSVLEGNSGTSAAVFTVSLSAPSPGPVTVKVSTANGTATAGSDYTAVPSTILTFAPGETTKAVSVSILGDTTSEVDETFSVKLATATGAIIADTVGAGKILNDDNKLHIGNVSANEGNSGSTIFQFVVTMTPASTGVVKVHYSTANGTATAPSDYTAKSGTITFAAGQTTQTISITVKGDTVVEPNETFFVNLDTPTGAIIADGKGQGTIVNDDSAPLLLADTAVAAPKSVPSLTSSQLAPIVAEALARYRSAGLDAASLALLSHTSVRIADLPGRELGLGGAVGVIIDANAAGQGWYVDPNPRTDGEFARPGGADSRGVDLLSVVLHEMGHVLGMDDVASASNPGQVMDDVISVGERRVPQASTPTAGTSAPVVLGSAGGQASSVAGPDVSALALISRDQALDALAGLMGRPRRSLRY